MMDGGFFVSRGELVQWLNKTFKVLTTSFKLHACSLRALFIYFFLLITIQSMLNSSIVVKPRKNRATWYWRSILSDIRCDSSREGAIE